MRCCFSWLRDLVLFNVLSSMLSLAAQLCNSYICGCVCAWIREIERERWRGRTLRGVVFGCCAMVLGHTNWISCCRWYSVVHAEVQCANRQSHDSRYDMSDFCLIWDVASAFAPSKSRPQIMFCINLSMRFVWLLIERLDGRHWICDSTREIAIIL